MEIGSKVFLKEDNSVHTITDILNSRSQGKPYYELDGGNIYGEDEIAEQQETPGEYRVSVDIADNVLIAIIYKGDVEVARGHGHIIHPGDFGIAQALSFACSRAYQSLGGNTRQNNYKTY